MVEDAPSSRARQWRRQFQSSFLAGSLPPDAELPLYDAILTEMANTPLQGEDLKSSKLHIVLLAISDLQFSTDPQLHLREHILILIETWTAMPNSPVLQHLEYKKQKALEDIENSKRQEEMKRKKEIAAQLAAQEAAIEFERQCRKTLAPLLPEDLLARIYHEAVFYYSRIEDECKGQLERDYPQEQRLLYNAALVSRQWNSAVSRIMYRGRIHINDTRTLNLFIRTMRDNAQLASSIQHLLLNPPYHEPDFKNVANVLLALCPNLRRLEGSFLFPKDVQLPVFANLEGLSVWDQALHRLAPLLLHTPNLTSFAVLCFQLEPEWNSIRMFGRHPEGLGADLEGTPPPVYSLKQVRISQCTLTTEQWKWLLASSTALEYAQLQETNESSDGFGGVIGPHVKHVHLKGMLDAPQQGNEDLSRSIRLYTALKTLQVSGREWPWEQLLRDVKSSLETLNISYSDRGCSAVCRALDDRAWQTGLRSLIVRHWAESDYFYGIKAVDVQRNRTMLEETCKARGISLVWVTEGSNTVTSYLGPTAADLMP